MWVDNIICTIYQWVAREMAFFAARNVNADKQGGVLGAFAAGRALRPGV